MALISKLTKIFDDYIDFNSLMAHLSGLNDEPLYEVVTYLLHYDLDSLGFYYIDMDIKVIPEKTSGFISEYLSEIQKILFITYQDWIYSGPESLEELNDDTQHKLIAHMGNSINIHSYFKISELQTFSPLTDQHLLHFGVKRFEDSNNSSNDTVQESTSDKQLVGIDKHNFESREFKRTGQAIAKYIWSMDKYKKIRTGDMVQQVKAVLYDIKDTVPEDKTIREWLSAIAPEYAQKPGRSAKNSLTEITLIMKK